MTQTLADLTPAASAQAFTPRPIITIGSGGIVRDAHLPAYRKAGFPVVATIDPDLAKAQALAADFNIPASFASIPEALSAIDTRDIIWDLAIPARFVPKVLPQLPDGAAVLIQKPIGENLGEAVAISKICNEKKLIAAANFSLRWAPVMVAARKLFAEGKIGTLHQLQVDVLTYTPWHLWQFMIGIPRLEILYHSIHYVDFVRSWLGNPKRVLAKTTRNPLSGPLAATRSNIILDYGDQMQVIINTQHTHAFEETQRSQVLWEGTDGALEAVMGLNLDYPKGKPDRLRYAKRNADGKSDGWTVVPTEGEWFPDAFVGSMTSLQSFLAGVTTELPTRISDALDTMRTVEAAYISSEQDGQPLPEIQ
ncbi:MAG TPA: Gfo/Idh/MocA family oxidoreductase [Acidobacteriaceae bacterium]|nr:Gfo/Idh/MocA family oxidoreductase [Acidobacteriaceae bacterium]